MLSPKKIVHRKVFNRLGQKRKGQRKRGSYLAFGSIGLKATSSSWLTSRQIEAGRKVLSRRCKGAKITIRVFPWRPVTAKGLNATMGSGTGSIEYFMFPVKPGRIIYEIQGANYDVAKQALKVASYKLPFTTKVISNSI